MATQIDIKKMIDNFLQWKLPSDFSPDCGISFRKTSILGNHTFEPIGTNLFHAGQAKEMIEFMLKDALSQPNEPIGKIDRVREIYPNELYGLVEIQWDKVKDGDLLYTAPPNLEAKIAELETMQIMVTNANIDLCKQIAELTAKEEQMRGALKDYGGHINHCINQPCTCGYTKILEEYK